MEYKPVEMIVPASGQPHARPQPPRWLRLLVRLLGYELA